MAGKIVADTLEHSTAGSIATNYVVEGSAKAWGLFNGTGTIAVRDSFNVSGITDLAVGKMTVSKTNAMGSVDYATALHSGVDDTAGSSTYNPQIYTRAAGSFNIATYSNTTGQDHAYVDVTVHGDLA